VDTIGNAIAITLMMVLFLGMGIWLFAALLLVGTIGMFFLGDMSLARIGAIMSQVIWRSASTWELAAIPLFILMGEIIFKTDIAQRLFRGLSPWVDWIPGRLLHANVGGCTIFAALCGSSIATTATIGRITVHELGKRHYDRNLTLGSLAGAGSFGLMIPPSINLIIFGVLAEVSIGRLFAAGVFPGLLLAALYSGYIVLCCTIRPEKAPKDDLQYCWRDRLRALVDLLPITVLIVAVLGSIYSGLATPSESAVIGLVATILLGSMTRQLSCKILFQALMGAVRTSAMILSLMVGASFLSVALGYLHVPQQVSHAIGALDLPPYALIALLTLFYILLGAFLDGISLMVMTLAIVLPLVVGAGFDPVWFGIFLILMAELALITPPVGLNLFVLQGLTKTGIAQLSFAAFPFFLLILATGVLLVLFPWIALWLPRQLF